MEAHQSGSGLSPVMRTTATYLLAGLGMLLVGAAVQPRFKAAKVQPEAERILFPELSDASKAASLDIMRYDDELATISQFKVAQSGGVWVLPMHQNYPADAKDQLAAAATELVDLKSLDVVADSPGDHETFGVVEPDPEKLKPGMTGIGELVEIRDASGKKLARLVVGKEAKRNAAGGPPEGGRTLRYVRKAGQDPVYVAELDMSKFSTDFGQWIEKDLLKLSPWDVRRLTLDDYSLAAVESDGRLRVEQQRKNRIELAYDDKDAKWSLVKLESFAPDDPAKGKEERLADAEELASTNLNDLRNALGDLKIIDVARKPAGLSAELKAAESFTGDPAAVASLQQRGFLPLRNGDILSTDGETIVGMKGGVEYVLRFGAATSVATGEKEKDDKDGGKGDDTGETEGRYVLVMARFNESLLEKPALEPVPDAPADPAAKKEGDAPKPDPAKQGRGGRSSDSPFRLVALLADDDKPASPPAADPVKPAAAEGPAAGEPKKEPSAADALKAADEAEAKMQAAIEERRRVERENRRKQEEYDDQVKAAQKKVRELNNRFADWYYIVSDKEYAKIHLGRGDVVQAKEKAEDKTGDAKPDAKADEAK